jgi:hypothetical protein
VTNTKNQYSENNLLGLKTGDIIYARVIKFPIIAHIGIVIVENDSVVVYHNTPKGFNSIGGSILINTFDDWIKTRTILSITPSDITADSIKQLTNENLKRKFDLIRFNCEHYVYLLKDGKPKSPQLWRWLIATAAILL